MSQQDTSALGSHWRGDGELEWVEPRSAPNWTFQSMDLGERRCIGNCMVEVQFGRLVCGWRSWHEMLVCDQARSSGLVIKGGHT